LKLLVVLFIIITTQVFGQHSPDLKFTPLDTLKIIGDKEFASQYKVVLKTNDPNSFIAKEQLISDSRNYLLQKTGRNKWVVYLYEVDEQVSLNRQGMFITYRYESRHASRNVFTFSKTCVLIDVKGHSSLDLTAYLDIQQQDTPAQKTNEPDSVYENRVDNTPFHTHIYNTQINVQGNYLSMKTTCRIDSVKQVEPFSKKVQQIAEGDGVDPGGVYKYVNGVFVKIKTYKPGLKGLWPINVSIAKTH
jgi:hypothetical protein